MGLSPVWTVREHVSNNIKFHFEQHSVITKPQILHGLLKHKRLKDATNMLGFKDVKGKRAPDTMVENVTKALISFKKSRKFDIRAACR